MTSDSKEVLAAATSPEEQYPTDEGTETNRPRSFSTASEASEDSTSALLPEVTFGPSTGLAPTIMGSPRSNRENQPLLGPSTGRHQEIDDYNQWPGLVLIS